MNMESVGTRQDIDRARRLARRHGYRIERARGPLHSSNHGGLQLVDVHTNTVYAGAHFDCTAAEIIAHVESQAADRPAKYYRW